MNLLGIETATHSCGAALTHDEALVVEYRSALKNAHGRLLTIAVARLLADAGWQSRDLDAIAVSIGPGSFTGLRIGLALAKGLALAHDLPIIAVPTLEALASQAPAASGLIAPLLRARADEYYLAVIRRSEGGDEKTMPERVIRWHELQEQVPHDAMLISTAPLPPLPAGWQAAPLHFGLPSGWTIARLGYQRQRTGETTAAELLEPHYLQEFIVGKPKPPVIVAGQDGL